MEQAQVHDNREKMRFEMQVDGQVVFADYRRQPGRLVITYVEAPVALRGTGAAGRLMKGMLEEARAEGVKVLPLCPYARAWMQRHPEYKDLAD
jgi:predicted GNAT family acetyltransferase